jgi:hypothetical protein
LPAGPSSLTVAVLLALGARAGAAIASVLNVALAVPLRSTQEEHEERADHHAGKANLAERRNRDRHPEPGRATVASRTRPPVRTVAPRTPLPPLGVLPDHETDHRCGLGGPLRC